MSTKQLALQLVKSTAIYKKYKAQLDIQGLVSQLSPIGPSPDFPDVDCSAIRAEHTVDKIEPVEQKSTHIVKEVELTKEISVNEIDMSASKVDNTFLRS